MPKRSLSLPILGLAVLIVAGLLSWWGAAQLRRDAVGGGVGIATPTAVMRSPTSSVAVPTVSAIEASITPIPPGERALKLPTATHGSPCPVSTGSREAVPEASYIFGSGGFWFGSGPVYLSLGWHDQRTDLAVFSLDRVPYEEGYYRAKSPWVARPDYVGRIRVRGRQIDQAGTKMVKFSHNGSGPKEELGVYSYGGRSIPRWSFWPASLDVPGPGCYALQIDSEASTDIIIFETTRSSPAFSPVATPQTDRLAGR